MVKLSLPSTISGTKAPLSVLYVSALAALQAAYLIFRGVYDPIAADPARAFSERLVGGIIQIIFALAIGYFTLRFYNGHRRARLPIASVQICSCLVNASSVYNYISYTQQVGQHQYGFPFLAAAALVLSALAIVAIFLPATNRYIQHSEEYR